MVVGLKLQGVDVQIQAADPLLPAAACEYETMSHILIIIGDKIN